MGRLATGFWNFEAARLFQFKGLGHAWTWASVLGLGTGVALRFAASKGFKNEGHFKSFKL